MPNDRNVKQFLRWLPALLYIAVIITLSTQSIPGRLPGKYTDKLVHFCIYGVLCALAYAPLYRNSHANPFIGVILLSLATGALDETLQYFNPARTASFADLLADGFGAVASGMLCLKIMGKRPAGADRK
jgi:VanZ family protein